MGSQTLYVVQAFQRTSGELIPLIQMGVGSETDALARVERDSAEVDGIIAFSKIVDAATGGMIGTPTVLARRGQVPDILSFD